MKKLVGLARWTPLRDSAKIAQPCVGQAWERTFMLYCIVKSYISYFDVLVTSFLHPLGSSFPKRTSGGRYCGNEKRGLGSSEGRSMFFSYYRNLYLYHRYDFLTSVPNQPGPFTFTQARFTHPSDATAPSKIGGINPRIP